MILRYIFESEIRRNGNLKELFGKSDVHVSPET